MFAGAVCARPAYRSAFGAQIRRRDPLFARARCRRHCGVLALAVAPALRNVWRAKSRLADRTVCGCRKIGWPDRRAFLAAGAAHAAGPEALWPRLTVPTTAHKGPRETRVNRRCAKAGRYSQLLTESLFGRLFATDCKMLMAQLMWHYAFFLFGLKPMGLEVPQNYCK